MWIWLRSFPINEVVTLQLQVTLNCRKSRKRYYVMEGTVQIMDYPATHIYANRIQDELCKLFVCFEQSLKSSICGSKNRRSMSCHVEN